MHFACSIGQDIENAILSINTVILYVIIFALLGLLIFLFVRNALKRHKFTATSDSDVFEEMDRRSRQRNLQALLARFPNLEQSFAWIDEQLMTEHRARYIWIALEQEWCCEDKSGREEMPCCCRPSRVAFRAENENRSFQIDEYQAGQYLTADENKLMGWGLMERCRMLVPYRKYRMHVNRITRSFFVENEVPVNWKTDTVIKEEYSVEVW